MHRVNISTWLYMSLICKSANMGIFINGNSATPDDVSPGYFMRLDNSFLIRLNIIKHCYNVTTVMERSHTGKVAVQQRLADTDRLVAFVLTPFRRIG